MGYVWDSINYIGEGGGDTMINPDLRFTYHATNIMMELAEDVLDD